mmetsp:Transcript_25253/g.71376  ORF Transcript_25253/g.71376 Transcript_25253/m.71376 type:complete len:228 (-) Transcript_25253:2245-2928(-)
MDSPRGAADRRAKGGPIRERGGTHARVGSRIQCRGCPQFFAVPAVWRPGVPRRQPWRCSQQAGRRRAAVLHRPHRPHRRRGAAPRGQARRHCPAWPQSENHCVGYVRDGGHPDPRRLSPPRRVCGALLPGRGQARHGWPGRRSQNRSVRLAQRNDRGPLQRRSQQDSRCRLLSERGWHRSGWGEPHQVPSARGPQCGHSRRPSGQERQAASRVLHWLGRKPSSRRHG